MKVDITKTHESFTDDKGVLVEYTQFWVVADKDTKIKIKVSKTFSKATILSINRSILSKMLFTLYISRLDKSYISKPNN